MFSLNPRSRLDAGLRWSFAFGYSNCRHTFIFFHFFFFYNSIVKNDAAYDKETDWMSTGAFAKKAVMLLFPVLGGIWPKHRRKCSKKWACELFSPLSARSYVNSSSFSSDTPMGWIPTEARRLRFMTCLIAGFISVIKWYVVCGWFLYFTTCQPFPLPSICQNHVGPNQISTMWAV